MEPTSPMYVRKRKKWKGYSTNIWDTSVKPEVNGFVFISMKTRIKGYGIVYAHIVSISLVVSYIQYGDSGGSHKRHNVAFVTSN